MGLWLFLIFIGLPILEIVLFIQIGGAIGAPADACHHPALSASPASR